MNYDEFLQRVAHDIPVVVSVNYRLAPEHRYISKPIQDAFDAFEFVDDHNQCFEGVDLKQCFLAGDSAGANIAHLRASEHMFENPKVIGMLSIQPFCGGEEQTEPVRDAGGERGAFGLDVEGVFG